MIEKSDLQNYNVSITNKAPRDHIYQSNGSIIVTFKKTLNVSIQANATNIYIDESIKFSTIGEMDDQIAEIRWQFGDGSENSTESQPIHQFSTVGIYTVTAIIQDQEGYQHFKWIIINVEEVYVPYYPRYGYGRGRLSGYSLGFFVTLGLLAIVGIAHKTKPSSLRN